MESSDRTEDLVAYWLVELGNPDCPKEHLARLDRWLAERPEHPRALEEMQAAFENQQRTSAGETMSDSCRRFLHLLTKEASAEKAHDLQLLTGAFLRLPEKRRHVLALHLEGLNHAEIAERTGLTPETVAAHLKWVLVCLEPFVIP